MNDRKKRSDVLNSDSCSAAYDLKSNRHEDAVSDSQSSSSAFVSFQEIEKNEKNDSTDFTKRVSHEGSKYQPESSFIGQRLISGAIKSFMRLRSMVTGNYQSTESSRLLPERGRLESHSSSDSTTAPSQQMHHPAGSSGEGYEELFKDSVPCPSCRGLGRVPKDQANQLVALIPLSDDRLKPRRTILWVAIAVGLCAIAAALLIFFLMPRNIILSSNKPFLQPKSIDINPQAMFANFTVTNRYNVSNSNFYAVTISGVFMKALYSNAIIAQAYAYRKVPLEISPRAITQLYIDIDFVLSGDHGSLVSHCMSNWSWIHNLPILFEVTTNYTYMGHSEQATLTTFQTVSCHPPPPPPTTAPPITMATTNAALATTTAAKPTKIKSSKLQHNITDSVPLNSAHSHKEDKPHLG